MSDDFAVSIVQLQKDDGTRLTICGQEVEEDEVTFSSDDDRTIQTLKDKINSLHFADNPRRSSRIKVYSSPGFAAGSQQSWVHHNREEAIEEGRHYGFIDLDWLEQQQQQQQRQQQDGEWRVLFEYGNASLFFY